MINAVLPQVNVAKSIIFVKGKKMVGPGALTITGNAVKQADKFGEINPYYGLRKEPVYTKLRFAGLEQMYRVDNAITSNGGLISEVLSQLLSISVDNVKNPVAELQNINMQTISVVSYLIERGVDEVKIVRFINQPIIKKYLNAQKANESLFNKEAGNELSKDELIKKVLTDLNYEGSTLPSLADEWVFENDDYKFTPNQFFVLSYFLQLVDQARMYGAFNSTQNSDTKGLKDKQALDEVDVRLNGILPSKDIQSLIPEDTIYDSLSQGIIGPFYTYGRRSYSIFNKFYAIEGSIVGSALTNLKNNYAEYEKGVNKDRIRQAIENDFQLFLIHNFVLDNEFDRLMKGKESLPNRMLNLKNKLPDNLIMQAFLPMINFTKDVNTGELISGLRLFEKELQALDEQALSISIEEIANEDLELYKDLVKFLMYQTGLNLSSFNYSKVLPVGLESNRESSPEYMYVYQDIIQEGLKQMKDKIKTEEQAQSLLNQFKVLFDLNNSRFLKRSHYSGHPIKVQYFKSGNEWNKRFTDSNDKEFKLLGNAYQKRYNLEYLGNVVVDPIEETNKQYFPSNETSVTDSYISTPKNTIPLKIISGGQYGGDFGGLLAAQELGLETGGTAPKGYKVDYTDKRSRQGTNPDLKNFGLTEDSSSDYPSRTMKNVDNSDGTIAYLWGSSVGTSKTIGYAQTKKWTNQDTNFRGKPYKPYLIITTKDISQAAEQIKTFVETNNINTLNIAGHRETSQPGIEMFVKNSLVQGLKDVNLSRRESAVQLNLFTDDPSMFILDNVEFTDFEGNIITNVDQIKKNEPSIQLDTLYQEILNNWNTYFPNEAYFTDEEKMQTIRLIESGELTLICNF